MRKLLWLPQLAVSFFLGIVLSSGGTHTVQVVQRADASGVSARPGLPNMLNESGAIAAVRDGTTAQSLYLYRTYVSGSNYQRLEFISDASWQYILSSNATAAAQGLRFGTAGSSRFEIPTTGNVAFRPITDGTYDLGATAQKYQNLYTERVLATGSGASGESTLNATATWNANVTHSLIYGEVTDTLSLAESYLIQLATGGTAKFVVRKDGEVGAPSDQGYAFSSTTNATGTKDLKLVRSAANVLRVDDGAGGLGKILGGKLVEANTAGSGSPNVLTAIESGTVLTNEGTTVANYHTLPAAAAGMTFLFVVADTDGLRVTATGDDTIRLAGSVSAAAGFCESAVIGNVVILTAINATQWVAVTIVGTWTVTWLDVEPAPRGLLDKLPWAEETAARAA